MEETLNPTIELNRLIKEGNFEEAFNKAFSSGDPQIVSWLCLQVGLSTSLRGVYQCNFIHFFLSYSTKGGPSLVGGIENA